MPAKPAYKRGPCCQVQNATGCHAWPAAVMLTSGLAAVCRSHFNKCLPDLAESSLIGGGYGRRWGFGSLCCSSCSVSCCSACRAESISETTCIFHSLKEFLQRSSA